MVIKKFQSVNIRATNMAADLNWHQFVTGNPGFFFFFFLLFRPSSVAWYNAEVNRVTSGWGRWTARPSLNMRPNRKSCVNASFVDVGTIPTTRPEPHAELNFPFLYTHTHTLQIRLPLLSRTIENTLHSTSVAFSKMLFSGNQATVWYMLITSDCTAHYASEVNYQQSEGKIGPSLLRLIPAIFHMQRIMCVLTSCLCRVSMFNFSFVHLCSPIYQS